VTIREKIQALIDMGECETVAEARAYLADMGEIGDGDED
jgi:hypothetical protein